jgi:hypothetical protein
LAILQSLLIDGWVQPDGCQLVGLELDPRMPLNLRKVDALQELSRLSRREKADIWRGAVC